MLVWPEPDRHLYSVDQVDELVYFVAFSIHLFRKLNCVERIMVTLN